MANSTWQHRRSQFEHVGCVYVMLGCFAIGAQETVEMEAAVCVKLGPKPFHGILDALYLSDLWPMRTEQHWRIVHLGGPKGEDS